MPGQDQARRDPRDLEAAARASIEQRADRVLTEAEWSLARVKLLDFVGILHDWARTVTPSRRGKVEIYASQNLPYDFDPER
jgi:hypothetical protein